jgi:hypothetical protein
MKLSSTISHRQTDHNKYLMRDLINLFDNLIHESVGLARRKPGEQFRNSSGDVIVFQGLYFFPEKGNYKDETSLADGLELACRDLGILPSQVYWTNRANARMLAFGIAHFTDLTNKDYYLGRYLATINANRNANSFPHEAIPGGFVYQSAVGLKERSGYKPSDILTDFENQTPETIYQQIVAKFGQDSDLARATQAFMISDSFPLVIDKGDINFTAFRDYFCEMWQPMALVLGKAVNGNAGEAAEIFFGPGQDFSDCTINFNKNAIGGLYDSLLVNSQGKQIKISSKGADGASASSTNLMKSLKKLESTPNGKKIIDKYDQEIAILDLINRVDARNGPLDLAVMFDLITPEEKSQVLSLKNYSSQDQIIGKKILSTKLQSWYKEKSAKDLSKIVPLDHMIAAIAFKAADYVNKNTKFGNAASDILNQSALIQMYTTATESEETITVKSFNAVYPSKTITGVLLDPTKVYYSTGNNGKYTFTILKNGAKAEDVTLATVKVNTVPDARQPGGVVPEPEIRSDIRASDTVKQAPRSDKSIYGRRRR